VLERRLAIAERRHRIGWTEQESAGALALTTIGESTLIVGALHVQLVLAGDQGASARLAGEQEALAVGQQREAAAALAPNAVQAAALALEAGPR